MKKRFIIIFLTLTVNLVLAQQIENIKKIYLPSLAIEYYANLDGMSQAVQSLFSQDGYKLFKSKDFDLSQGTTKTMDIDCIYGSYVAIICPEIPSTSFEFFIKEQFGVYNDTTKKSIAFVPYVLFKKQKLTLDVTNYNGKNYLGNCRLLILRREIVN